MLDLEQLQSAFPGYRFERSIIEHHSDMETVTVTLEYTKNHIGLLAQLQRAKQASQKETANHE